jgi:tRNA (adenine37-N6)-methyltransferase
VGLSVVKLLARRVNLLDIQGIDVLDGMPLLDIKPYVPEFDIRGVEKIGWYVTRSKKD